MVWLALADLFNDFKFFEFLSSYRQAQAEEIFVKVYKSIPGPGLAVKNVPEKLISYFHINQWEILCDWRIQACHNHVIVVHLAGVRNYGIEYASAKAAIFLAWVMPPTRL